MGVSIIEQSMHPVSSAVQSRKVSVNQRRVGVLEYVRVFDSTEEVVVTARSFTTFDAGHTPSVQQHEKVVFQACSHKCSVRMNPVEWCGKLSQATGSKKLCSVARWSEAYTVIDGWLQRHTTVHGTDAEEASDGGTRPG